MGPVEHLGRTVVEEDGLTRKVIGCAMRVHRALGPGFLESVYQNALLHELHKVGLPIECEKRLQVRYDGVVVGEYIADVVVEGRVIVENKAVQALDARARGPTCELPDRYRHRRCPPPELWSRQPAGQAQAPDL